MRHDSIMIVPAAPKRIRATIRLSNGRKRFTLPQRVSRERKAVIAMYRAGRGRRIVLSRATKSSASAGMARGRDKKAQRRHGFDDAFPIDEIEDICRD